MNKASGKLADGVRKLKTRPKAPAAVDAASAAASTPTKAVARERATTVSRATPAALHPDRVWPD